MKLRAATILILSFVFAPGIFAQAQSERIPGPDGNETRSDNYDGKFISSIMFDGNNGISRREILDVFNFEDDFAGKVNRLFVYPYSEEIQYRLKNQILALYRSRGYAKAKIGDPKTSPDGDSVRVVVPIDEGVRHRFGNIRIFGVKHLTTDEVGEFLSFRKGEVVNFVDVHNKILEQLPIFYGTKGFAEMYADYKNIQLHPVSKRTGEGTVDFDIVVDEGLRHRIEKIEIVGNCDTELVRTFFTSKEGEIFNRSKLDESIRKLEESGLFRKVDYWRDVEVRVADEARKVDRPNDTAEKMGYLTIVVRVNNISEIQDRNYYLNSVKFVGDNIDSDAELMKMFGLQLNGYFDVQNFLKNVREFNKTGRYKPIIEDDIDFEPASVGNANSEISERLNLTVRFWRLSNH